jgi:hypothetical protein
MLRHLMQKFILRVKYEGKLAAVLDSTGISISCEFILFAFQVSVARVITVAFQHATSVR